MAQQYKDVSNRMASYRQFMLFAVVGILLLGALLSVLSQFRAQRTSADASDDILTTPSTGLSGSATATLVEMTKVQSNAWDVANAHVVTGRIIFTRGLDRVTHE